MKLLAIDTSSDACSVAINLNHEIIEKFELTPRKHIEALKPMVESVLSEAGLTLKDLDGLAFGCGPGSFSGLRIACSFIQGLSAALNLPVAAVSTLASMALHTLDSYPDAIIIPALDARMGEIYTGAYHLNQTLNQSLNLSILLNDCIMNPLNFIDLKNITNDHKDTPIIGVGTGWHTQSVKDTWIELFNPLHIMPDQLPRAGDIALLAVKDFEVGHVLQFDQIQPIYLRNTIALNLEGQQALRDANLVKKSAV
jgi:tRNA threonylcarbamoyladenosine biosynthesis protein TsaB